MVAVRLLEHLASCGLPVSPAAVLAGLTDTRWPGRLELVAIDSQRSVMLDAAHNVASVAAFASYITEVWPSGLPLVFGALRDKDVGEMARALGSSATTLVCPPLATHRAVAPADLLTKLQAARPDLTAVTAPTTGAALEAAWARGNVIGATGSVFLVGAVAQHLALQP